MVPMESLEKNDLPAIKEVASAEQASFEEKPSEVRLHMHKDRFMLMTLVKFCIKHNCKQSCEIEKFAYALAVLISQPPTI
uniref:Uncharacterized protein n=1 Tax=Kalanchoe fedtschenkoi TaxID=63787 RepID=A0A7N0UWH0_KALFE